MRSIPEYRFPLRERLSILIPHRNLKEHIMAHLPNQVGFQLPRRAMLKLADMTGVELVCVSGAIWLTLDGDPKDIVLLPGDSFVTAHRRPAIVYALEPVCAKLLSRPGGPGLRGPDTGHEGGATSFVARLRRLLGRWWPSPAAQPVLR